MSANPFSSLNGSLPLQHPSSIDSYIAVDLYCFIFRPTSFVFVTFYIINFFIIFPLCSLILYYAMKEWQKKSSTPFSGTMSHSDCFTYNVAIIEIISVFRCIAYWYGAYADDINVIYIGGHFSSLTWNGETLFHVLTCVERYLAVVHPITYLSLKKERGTKIRNLSIVCVWLLCFAGLGLFAMQVFYVIIHFCMLIIALSVTAFCSLSVLCVLVRPIPGNQGKDKVDQSKQRALYSMVLILGALGIRFCGSLTWGVLFMSGQNNECFIMAVAVWANLPNSLVLPLLYLHRAGKLVCCKNNAQ